MGPAHFRPDHADWSIGESAIAGLRCDATTVGAPGSGARAELFMPAGTAPFAAVILLHGCNGVAPHSRIWAARLAQWGYAALLADSFGPHGFTEVCNRGRLVPPEAQARDAFDAALYLRMRPDILDKRIGVIGFSHGGRAVLKAVLAGAVRCGARTSRHLLRRSPATLVAIHPPRRSKPTH
jgi:dienelactone hydrolase